jgi:alpha-N-arabinofuranosidase
VPNNSTLSEALFWAGIVNTSIRLDDLIELITHTALVNHGGGLRKDREIVYPNPVHWACHLYANQSGRWPVSLRVSCPYFSVTQLHNLPAVEKTPYLDAAALLNDSGSELNLLVTNRHATESLTVEIALHHFPAQSEVLVQTLASTSSPSSPSYMAQNSWERPDEVKLVESKTRIEGRRLNYTFPACSLSGLRFRR